MSLKYKNKELWEKSMLENIETTNAKKIKSYLNETIFENIKTLLIFEYYSM